MWDVLGYVADAVLLTGFAVAMVVRRRLRPAAACSGEGPADDSPGAAEQNPSGILVQTRSIAEEQP